MKRLDQPGARVEGRTWSHIWFLVGALGAGLPAIRIERRAYARRLP